MSTHAVKDLDPLFFAEQDRLSGGPADELRAVFDQAGMMQ